MPHEKLLAALPLAALFAAVMMHNAAHAAGQEGMVVVRDPQTGQFRAPTPAEMKALAPVPVAGMRTPVPQAAIVVNQNGIRSVRLDETSQVYEVVHRAPDGKLVQQCVQGEQAADRALAQPATHEEPRHEDR